MKRPVLANERLSVTICRYEPGERHKAHTDTHSRIVFFCMATTEKKAPSGVIVMRPGDTLLKTYRARHEDVFGPGGATLAALENPSYSRALASILRRSARAQTGSCGWGKRSPCLPPAFGLSTAPSRSAAPGA
jgi:hypothetical protein